MKFAIVDAIRNESVRVVESNHGKNALQKFRNSLLSTGIYEIHKCKNRWVLSSSYGSYFIAMPIKED